MVWLRKLLVSAYRPLILLPLLAACTAQSGPFGAQRTAPTPTMVPTPVIAERPTYTVQRGDVTRSLDLTGRVVPVKQQDLFFRTDGFVKEVFVQRGDTVAEGDLLARLDEPEKYDADIAAAQLALEQARYDLEQMQLEAPLELANAELDVVEARLALTETLKDRQYLELPRVSDPLLIEKARADFDAARENYEYAQEVFEGVANKPTSDPDYISALSQLIEARRSYYQALATINWYEGKASSSEIAMADAKLAVAQATYDRAVAEVERLSQAGGTFEMRLAEAKVVDAESKLEMAVKAKESIELLAPFDGQVLSVGVTPGSQVTAFEAVMVLADPAALEITAIPAPEELILLGVGQFATVRLTNQSGKEFSAHITTLPALGSEAGESAGLNYVHFALDETGVTLTQGEVATIVIELETRQNVLWLPPGALRTYQGLDYVLVETNGVQRRANVTLGLRSDERVEISQGLEEGQVVISP